MKNLKIILLLLASLSIGACHSNKSKHLEQDKAAFANTSPERYKEEMTPQKKQILIDDSPITINRKLIKTGYITFETTDLQATKSQILDAVKKYEGYIASDNESKQYNRISNSIRIRVPAINFDQLLNDASKGISIFDEKNISIDDVTAEFLDIAARIKTKKALEARYLKLLDKAKKVSEMLEIERQIGQLRTEIEAVTGRLKYLKSQVSYATLNISYYKNIPTENKFGNKFSNGFKNGWDNLTWFFVGIINIWPFVLLFIAALFIIRNIRKKRKSKKRN
jgi:hypothetical protein